ncbi:MAG: S1 RNA-binding domain-containing protein, partial [Actinobacteria bacterium]|nr:S1 RNA-binding domain-containing protein [Actinomycetota bacterium]
DKPRYSDYRENRRRGTILTDAEFLARRESVDREMLVRQQGDRTQIAILEDKVLVEHYVNRNSNISYVGNVYLGKVQNVLPSMEAAFVDIGKGRNAVLYAGEVNWDATGLADNQERKIEKVLKTGQSVLVQVTKDPIGQKGARLTSQISLEAAEEIARQLRLRDLGGIIVIDFIDMILESNREQVLRRLVECLGRDRTKHQVAEVTSLGLVQMTRKRVGQGLIEAFSTTCDSCGGRGIHVHMEPVNKKSLDREFVPAKVNKEENLSSDDSESDEKESLDENVTPAKKDGDSGQKKGFGRRKRRAASSGVVTA